jgi:hypothetical protein
MTRSTLAQNGREVMRRSLVGILVAIALLLSGPAFAQRPTAPLATFPTQQLAQQHCPSDTGVWLNLPTGIYHFQGQRWSGNTKSGAYVCQHEADQAGDRATRNGQ